MIYEFIATITAGFGMAGLAMIIRQLTQLMGKQAPKWLIPFFAAVGMLGFQVHQEYYWYEQKVAQLPRSIQVVKTIDTTTWFRPWSYIRPQIVRFMAIDTAHVESNAHNPQLKLFNLYLYERRIRDKRVIQVIDCKQQRRADYPPQADTLSQDLSWYPLAVDDPIFMALCQ